MTPRYFAWLQFYTRALVAPSIFGVTIQCVKYFGGYHSTNHMGNLLVTTSTCCPTPAHTADPVFPTAQFGISWQQTTEDKWHHQPHARYI